MNPNLTPITKLKPFTRFIYTIGELPTSYLMSMTYEEQLIWLCNYLEKTVIPAINNNGQAVEELQNKFIELKNYVDEYFEDLDVQEEINNKLDEMAESGELAEIISQYVELQNIKVYENVNSMINATNLANGSYAETLGFYEIGDGGKARYLIRTLTIHDTIDNITLFAINNTDNLVAELIIDDYNILKFGAKSGEDIITIINKVLSLVNDGDTIIIPKGSYDINTSITIDKVITIIGESNINDNGTVLNFDGTSGFILEKGYINIKNISIQGTNKLNYENVNLENNIGTFGIHFKYTDTITSGGCKIENCSISGFNVGILMNSNRTSNIWSGAYRVIDKTYIGYNDIGIAVIKGATYNKLCNCIITSSNKHGIYCVTDTSYQNLEISNTSLENNGINTGYTNLTAKDYGIYVGSNSKVKLTNCYIETTDIYVENMGNVGLISTYIHNNVRIFGNGTITSEGSLGNNKKELSFGNNIAGSSTNVGLTVTNTYENKDVTHITSSNNGNNVLYLPDFLFVTTAAKFINNITFECDIKINNAPEDFGIKPYFDMVVTDAGGNDGGNIPNMYDSKNVILPRNEWTHVIFKWRPRIATGYITNGDNIIYRLSCYLYMTNSLTDNTSDFSQTNLNIDLSNFKLTLHTND